MSATRPRLTAVERRQAVLDTACRVFFESSYRGATNMIRSVIGRKVAPVSIAL